MLFLSTLWWWSNDDYIQFYLFGFWMYDFIQYGIHDAWIHIHKYVCEFIENIKFIHKKCMGSQTKMCKNAWIHTILHQEWSQVHSLSCKGNPKHSPSAPTRPNPAAPIIAATRATINKTMMKNKLLCWPFQWPGEGGWILLLPIIVPHQSTSNVQQVFFSS